MTTPLRAVAGRAQQAHESDDDREAHDLASEFLHSFSDDDEDIDLAPKPTALAPSVELVLVAIAANAPVPRNRQTSRRRKPRKRALRSRRAIRQAIAQVTP